MNTYNLESEQLLRPCLNEKDVANLVKFLQNFSLTRDTFQQLKAIVLAHGAAVLVFLEPIYVRLEGKNQPALESKLRKLTAIAIELCQNHKINFLNFLYERGYKKVPYRNIAKTKAQMQLIVFLCKLDQLLYLCRAMKLFNIYQKPVEDLISQCVSSNSFNALQLACLNKCYSEFNCKQSQIKNISIYKYKFQGLFKLEVPQGKAKSDDSYSSSSEDQKTVQIKNFKNPPKSSANNQETFLAKFMDQSQYSKQNYSRSSSMGSSQQENTDFYDFHGANESSLSSQAQIQSPTQASPNNKFLCCKRHFFEDEVIRDPENLRTAFLQIKAPFNKKDILELKRTFCSFLNAEGGNAYIGIRRSSRGRQVQPDLYTELQKEETLRSLRQVAQKIEPGIIAQKMYEVEFVPIRNRQTNAYIAGANVIRIRVDYGSRDEFYSFEHEGHDHFAFRSDFEVIEKNGRQLLKSYRGIILNPMKVPEPSHRNPCQKPEVGEALNTKKPVRKQNTKDPNKSKDDSLEALKEKGNESQVTKINTSKAESSFSIDGLGSFSNFTSSTRHSSHTRTEGLNEKSTHVSNAGPNYRDGRGEIFYLDTGAYKQTCESVSEQGFYFYASGLDEKNLTPIFDKKGITSEVSIEKFREKKLVLKVNKAAISQARDIFNKTNKKYNEKGIFVYQMSFELRVENVQQAVGLLQTIKKKFSVYKKNLLRFQQLKDALKAFILLECQKIPVSFYIEQNR